MVYQLVEAILTITADTYVVRSGELALESNQFQDWETPVLKPAP